MAGPLTVGSGIHSPVGLILHGAFFIWEYDMSVGERKTAVALLSVISNSILVLLKIFIGILIAIPIVIIVIVFVILAGLAVIGSGFNKGVIISMVAVAVILFLTLVPLFTMFQARYMTRVYDGVTPAVSQ